jgi:hypothetical protein
MKSFGKRCRNVFATIKIGKPKCHPTQRAADKWDSARFLGIFYASAKSRSQALSASHPPAGNANRWVAIMPKRLDFSFQSEKKLCQTLFYLLLSLFL